MSMTRRRFLAATAGSASAAWLSGCTGFTSAVDSSSGADLTFMTWASDAEATAFKRLVAAFEDAHRGVSVDLKLVPYAEMFTNLDAQLQSGTAPDVFRVDYPTMGLYSSTEQLLDLSDQFDTGDAADFLPALWEGVQYDGTQYGVPHQTDTTAVLYRPDLLAAAGIASVPDTLDNAWSWEEFADVSDRLRASLPTGTAPFMYDWQQLGAFRWMTWLFEAGGRLLDDDLETPIVHSDEGLRALEFTRSFFDNDWVPANSSVKSGSYPDTVFISENIAMAFAGNFLLPAVDAGVKGKFEWKATYQPRDVRAASDLGGNALAATAQASDPDLAAEFLRFMVAPDNMASFCAEAVELPTRQSLVGRRLDYTVRPDLVPVFAEQATTMTEQDVAQVTVPYFGQINSLLLNELELCFNSGQSADDTLANIASGIEEAAQA